MYGNFCGPYWSDGSIQQSVENHTEKPVDDLDECCRKHDVAYAKQRRNPSVSLNFHDHKFLNCVRRVANEEGLSYKSLYRYLIGTTIPYQIKDQRQEMPRGKRIRARESKSLKKAEKKVEKEVKNENRRAPVNSTPATRQNQAQLKMWTPNRRQRRGAIPKRPPKKQNLVDQRCELKGSDYSQTVSVTTSNVPGDILYSLELHPSAINNTRLLFFSQMYDQYRLKGISIEYISQVGTQNNGQVVGFFDPDPDEVNTSQPILLNKAYSGKGKPAQIWGTANGQPFRWSWKPPQSGRDLIRYCSTVGEKRTYSYGNFYLLAGSSYASNMTIASIRVRYHIEFLVPLLESTPSTLYAYSGFTVSSPSASGIFGTGLTALSPQNNLTVVWETQQSFKFDVSPGFYWLILQIAGTGLSSPGLSGTNVAYTATNQVINGTNVSMTWMGRVQVISNTIASPCVITSSATATTVTAVTMRLFRIPNSVAIPTKEEQKIRDMVIKMLEEQKKNNNNSVSQQEVVIAKPRSGIHTPLSLEDFS